MYRIFPPALIVICLAAVSLAQSPSSILKSANKSLGGEKVLRSLNSTALSGTITRASDRTTGRYELLTSPQFLFAESYDIGGFEVASGYNGKSGWLRDSRSGLRTLTGDAAKNFQTEVTYRNGRWLAAKTNKFKIAGGAKATINGIGANTVILTSPKGVQIKLYFDAASGRLIREEIPVADGVKTLDYSDYRTIQNVSTPFSIDVNLSGEVYQIRLDTAVYNQPNDLARFAYPQTSGEPLPDIPALLSEVRANADRVNEILENYSYTQLTTVREPDKTGRLTDKSSEKRELTFYKGRRINRLIEKDGKPLSNSEQESEDRDAAERVGEIDKEESKRGRNLDEENRRFGLSEALKGSLLVNPRRERFKNRDVIVFDYEPNPAFKPQSRAERLFALCTGTVWVDTATKQVVRLEAFLTKSAGNFLAKAKQGASFTLDNELVNDEIWLPSQADINLSVKILFAGININNLIKYGDYRRFRTEVKDATVNDPVKPEE